MRWPDARLYTVLHKRGAVSDTIERLRISPSYLNLFPGWPKYYRYLLPLMPSAVKWKFPNDTDLVVSFSHCVAKGVKPPPGVPHVCYCFTPMRYAWHQREQYFRDAGLKAKLRDSLLSRIREWDKRTATNVTHFIAISETIRTRIRECYDRDSVVIHPPVDTEFYTPANVSREDFYLVVSALAPYKRFDLAIEACKKLQRQLVVIGTGQDAAKLKQAGGENVQFLGWQSDEVIRDHYRRCRAVLFPAEEDFGIVPVEAQACGAPVIAFGRGGATETVTSESGVFFEEQNTDSMVSAMEQFEKMTFDTSLTRQNAERFNTARYERELFAFIDDVRRSSTNTSASTESQS